MNINTIDIRSLLIQNLASSAARKGGLSENEAKCWAKTLADMILQSEDFEFDDIEQLITDPFAIDSFLVKSCEKLSDLEVAKIFPSVEKTHYLCAGKNEDSQGIETICQDRNPHQVFKKKREEMHIKL